MGEAGREAKGEEEEEEEEEEKVQAREEEEEEEEEATPEMAAKAFTLWWSSISSCFFRKFDGANNIVASGGIEFKARTLRHVRCPICYGDG